MSTGSRARELMNYSFLVLFANDHRIDAEELAFLEKLALEDHEIDDDERAVLQAIFSRVTPDEVAEKARMELARFRQRYGI